MRGRAAAALLDDVGELVGEQAAPLLAMGRVFAGSEDDVVAQSEGASPQTAGGAGGRCVTVDADAAEVFAEARLERTTHRVREAVTRPLAAVQVRLDFRSDFRGERKPGRGVFECAVVLLGLAVQLLVAGGTGAL